MLGHLQKILFLQKNKIRSNSLLKINCTINAVSQKRNATNLNKVSDFPAEVDAVVIGGGSVGCSTILHLSQLFKGNVVLLEKFQITSGTTWHTAGILWCFKPSESETIMQHQTRDLISSILPSITGDSAGWIETGSLHTLKNADEYKSFIQNVSVAKNMEVKLTEVVPNDIPNLHPLVSTKDVHIAVHSPGDGIMDPSTLCMSYIKAAVKFGAKVIENCSVTDVVTTEDDFGFKRVAGVVTSQGMIRTKNVINCAGAWAPCIGEMVGVRIPQLTFKHAYVVTDSIPGIKGTPIVKDEGAVYIKPQGSALQFGGYEMNPHLVKNLPLDFSFGLYDLDWDTFKPHYEAAINRIPAIEKAGIRSTICGPESFTPDGKPNMGESPSVRGFFVGSGFNSGGMMLGGGAGRQLAHWVYHGKPEIDLFNCDISRYPTNFYNYNKWLYESCHGKFAKRYGLVYKYDHSLSGRNQRFGPLHKIHQKHGALFGSKNGFERPAYYVIDKDGQRTASDLDVLPYDFYGCYGNQKHQSYPYCDEVLNDCTYDFPSKSYRLIGRECLTCRTAAAIFDTSSMSKYFVSGADMNRAMKRVFTRDVTTSNPGQFIYTLMLNQDGGIEGDAIVTKWKNELNENGYYVTTATSGEQYCLSRIKKIIGDMKLHCKIHNITEQRAIMSVQGPNSAKWLQSVTDDVAAADMRYGEWKDVEIGGKRVVLGRLSFVGELGYEIHCRKEDAIKVHDILMEKAYHYQACMAGYRAMESLSVETGFHHWPHSIKSSDNPVEAELIRFCDDTNAYVGSTALRKLRNEQPKKRLLYFTVESDVPPLFGNELILANDQIVGFLRNAAFAYALNCNIGCGYVESPKPLESLLNGDYNIERMGVKYPAKCHPSSPFDPHFQRMKGQYFNKEQNNLRSFLHNL